MSDLMRLIPYRQLLDWCVREYEKSGSIFGVSKILKRNEKHYPIFDGKIKTVFGPAAGPNGVSIFSSKIGRAWPFVCFTSLETPKMLPLFSYSSSTQFSSCL